MNKVVLSAIMLLFISTMLFSQTDMGKIHLAGSSDLNFSSMKMKLEYDGESQGDEVSTSQFNFEPSLGYFFADGLAIGLSVQYESESIEDETTTGFFTGPYITYYFGTSNVKPFLRGDLIFGNVTEGDTKAKASGWDLGAGVAVFLNDFISLDFGLMYGSVALKDPDDTKLKLITQGIAVSGGISIYL